MRHQVLKKPRQNPAQGKMTYDHTILQRVKYYDKEHQMTLATLSHREWSTTTKNIRWRWNNIHIGKTNVRYMGSSASMYSPYIISTDGKKRRREEQWIWRMLKWRCRVNSRRNKAFNNKRITHNLGKKVRAKGNLHPNQQTEFSNKFLFHPSLHTRGYWFHVNMSWRHWRLDLIGGLIPLIVLESPVPLSKLISYHISHVNSDFIISHGHTLAVCLGGL